MTISAIMGAIITGIKYLPEVIALLKEISVIIQQAETWYEKRQKIAQITQAISQASKTGDTSALEQIFSGAAGMAIPQSNAAVGAPAIKP